MSPKARFTTAVWKSLIGETLPFDFCTKTCCQGLIDKRLIANDNFWFVCCETGIKCRGKSYANINIFVVCIWTCILYNREIQLLYIALCWC